MSCKFWALTMASSTLELQRHSGWVLKCSSFTWLAKSWYCCFSSAPSEYHHSPRIFDTVLRNQSDQILYRNPMKLLSEWPDLNRYSVPKIWSLCLTCCLGWDASGVRAVCVVCWISRRRSSVSEFCFHLLSQWEMQMLKFNFLELESVLYLVQFSSLPDWPRRQLEKRRYCRLLRSHFLLD